MAKMNASIEKVTPNAVNLQIGGIAPNVLRELSGIYPTFVSAFKELVSNAYDADATLVEIQLAPDRSSITVKDNGSGMTPLEFQQDYVRIGGSVRRNNGDLTPGGRRPIGRKGIGFLAIARYCHTVEIHSHTHKINTFQKTIPLFAITGNHLSIPILDGQLAEAFTSLITIENIRCGEYELLSTDYILRGTSVVLTKEAWHRFANSSLAIEYSIDNRGLELKATIDYDYLLGLADTCNLESLQDFCQIQITTVNDVAMPTFTRIKLCLREFVQRELLTPQRRGRVRNIVSSSGLNRFLWHLSRSVPTEYEFTTQELQEHGLEALNRSMSPTPFTVQVIGASEMPCTLKRPLPRNMDGAEFDDIKIVNKPVIMDSAGLRAQGCILGFSQPIYPAELRGIAFRVRGVEIGQPNFLGVENDVPVKYRALLNQISGEIIVTEGLDAITAVTPGREGFYAENPQFQVLRKHLVGDGNFDLGVLGQVLAEVWEQQSIESSVQRIIQDTKRRRRAFVDAAHAITELFVTSSYGRILQRLSVRTDIKADGLRQAPEYSVGLQNTLRDYALELTDLEDSDYQIDREHRAVYINQNMEIWDVSLYLLGRDFTISFRQGEPDASLCEVDFETDIIYINWMHLTRSKLGDDMFFKSALFWRLAYLAADGDVDTMMNLAHHLLSITT